MYLGAPLWFLQLLRDITKIGTSNTTVCVNTNGSYAVVYISAKQIITCSSCHKNQTSCKHVNCLLSVIESCSNTQEDLPNALELFADLVHSKDLESTTSDVHTFQPSHTSRKSIPFCLPEGLTKVTSLPYFERFNWVDNVAHLVRQILILIVVHVSKPCGPVMYTLTIMPLLWQIISSSKPKVGLCWLEYIVCLNISWFTLVY